MTAPLQAAVFPPQFIVVGAIVLLSLLAAVVCITVGYSVVRKRDRHRRTPIRAELRSELLKRLYGTDEPDWEAWVDSLSARHRTELESLLDVYLRELSGEDAVALAALGEALGINSRSRRLMVTGDYWQRLHALTWLALLRDPPSRTLLKKHCTDTPRERAVAARILYLSGTDDCASTGIELLLGDDPSSFSVFGIDTLYRIAKLNPEPLFAQAAANADRWEPALTQQVLLVSQQLHTVIGASDLDWIHQSLSSPHDRTRSEAYHALEAYGWHRQLRGRIDLAAIAEEPDPVVRTSAYRMLSAWGDPPAVEWLCRLAAAEPTDRARVAAAHAIYPHRDQVSETLPAVLGDAWLWTAEHHRFDAIARSILTDWPATRTHLDQ